jgi:hypothetical protein
MGGIYDVSLKKAEDEYEVGTGVRVMLRFCFNYLRGCNFGITDGRSL